MLLLVVLGLVLAALCATATSGLSSSRQGTTTPALSTEHPARSAIAWDLRRCLQLVANLRADPPDDPLVVLLGGSSARECTVSDASWSLQTSRRNGSPVVCVNLGSRHRLFTQDRRLVKLLPPGEHLVFMGVNAGRFCNGYSDPPLVLPPPTLGSRARLLARRSTRVLPDWRKRQIADQWMVKRWPYFRARHRYNLRVLASAIRASLALGQHPIIIDMPRDMAIIKHRLDVPFGIYHRECRALAKRLGIPYVQFQYRTGLTNKDFSDLWHTIKTGQVKWQRQFSITVVTMLKKYGIGPSPSPSPSASSPPSSSPSPSSPPSAAPAIGAATG